MCCSECLWFIWWVPLPEVRQPTQLPWFWPKKPGPCLSVGQMWVLSYSCNLDACGKWRNEPSFGSWCAWRPGNRCVTLNHITCHVPSTFVSMNTKSERIQKLLKYSFVVTAAKPKSMSSLLSDFGFLFCHWIHPALTEKDTKGKCDSSILSTYLKHFYFINIKVIKHLQAKLCFVGMVWAICGTMGPRSNAW